MTRETNGANGVNGVLGNAPTNVLVKESLIGEARDVKSLGEGGVKNRGVLGAGGRRRHPLGALPPVYLPSRRGAGWG